MRPRLQFSLLGALAASLVAGVLLWLNLRPALRSDEVRYFDGEYRVLYRTSRAHGFPFTASAAHAELIALAEQYDADRAALLASAPPPQPVLSVPGVAGNLICALVLSLGAALLVTRLAR